MSSESRKRHEQSSASYSAVSTARQPTVSRTQPSTSSSVQFATARRSHQRVRRASLEAEIPEIQQAVETRSRSRREMQELNERLGGFIERTHYLQAQNKKLKEELQQLKSRWGRETEKVRKAYDAELQQMRRLLDEAERAKGEKDARLATLESQLRELRDMYTSKTAVTEQQADKLDRANRELADRDGEISLLRRRLSQLEEERTRLKEHAAKVKDDVARVHTDLESETAGRIALQTECQTLREELMFIKHIHEQELKELRSLIKTDADDSREFWKSEMSQAIHEIQKVYDEKVDTLRAELETIYMTKLREIAKGSTQSSNESAYLKDENRKLKETLADQRKRVADLTARVEQLERLLDDQRRELESERRRHSDEQDRLVQELSRCEADLRRVLNELQALMDTKISLEIEIAAYKKLLDAEGLALDASELSRQSSLRTTEKPSVVMEQRVERRTETARGQAGQAGQTRSVTYSSYDARSGHHEVRRATGMSAAADSKNAGTAAATAATLMAVNRFRRKKKQQK